MNTAHGCSVNAKTAAIVSVQHRDDGLVVVTAIRPMKADLKAVKASLEALQLELRDSITIDASGLGSALWGGLERPERRRGWTLATETGRDRQRIVDPLVAAVHVLDRLRFAAGLDHQDAMSRALASYRREVAEDGLIGSELVIALALAVRAKPRPMPRVY
jgi:hypothetical protein